MRVASLLLPLLLLAGCGSGEGVENSSTALPNVAAPAGKAWVDVVATTPEGGVVQGNPQAPIKLVEYGSRSCPVCGAFANTGIEPLRAKYIATGRVSYEFRDFWVHPQDPGLTLLGHCVPTEAFFPLLDAMFAGQAEFNARQTQEVFDRIQALPREQQPAAWAAALGYVDLMKRSGVPEAKAQQCLGDAKMLKTVTDQVQKASESGDVAGTPTFLINGKPVANVVSWEQLEPALRGAGAR